jgi:hypothetical protein
MPFQLSRLQRDRALMLQQIQQRRQRIRQLAKTCRSQGRAWAQTPQAPVQAFVAGFMLDQLRPLTPLEASPLKLSLLIAIKRLKALL